MSKQLNLKFIFTRVEFYEKSIRFVFLAMIAGAAFAMPAKTSNKATVKTSGETMIQTSGKTTAVDWAKQNGKDKRIGKFSFQGNYIDCSYNSYNLIRKSDEPEVEGKAKCKTGLVGVSFEYKKQYESGFFNEGMFTLASGFGNFKVMPKDGEEVKLKLDSVKLLELKMKFGKLIPLSISKDGYFKIGPFSGFDIHNTKLIIDGKNMPDGYKKVIRNYFLAFPLGIRTEYANKDWKFGLDMEYDFVFDKDSFMIDSVGFNDRLSNEYIFQVTGNVSKDFAKGRFMFRLTLTPFYRYVDYGECEYHIRDRETGYSIAEGNKNTGSSHEFGVRIGVQF